VAWRSARLLVAALVLAACDTAGSATVRIDQAEDELERLTADIAEAVELEVTAERPLGSRSRCQLPGGREGAANSLSLRGPLPESTDPVGRAAAMLIEAGYELVDSDLDDGVFGRRDGIRVTVMSDRPTRQLAIDANTGCRPLPE
jgi:hypothetical protein